MGDPPRGAPSDARASRAWESRRVRRRRALRTTSPSGPELQGPASLLVWLLLSANAITICGGRRATDRERRLATTPRYAQLRPGSGVALRTSHAYRACHTARRAGFRLFLFMHSMERPTATVRNVSVSSAGFRGVTGQLQVDVMNPNAFNVPLSGIDWQLSIGGARAVTGQVQLQQTHSRRGRVADHDRAVDQHRGRDDGGRGARQWRAHLRRSTRSFTFRPAVGQLDVEVKKTGELAM